MQVSEHIYTAKISFRVNAGPGQPMERIVYFHLVCGERVCLIDAGIAGCQEEIRALAASAGKTLAGIDLLILSHAHPDHIGGARGLQNMAGCSIAAHPLDVPWIEDVDQQYHDRPVPGFGTLVEGSVDVNTLLRDGDQISLGNGSTLQVIHTPGHSNGHIALWHEQDRVLIAGDSIPLPRQMPIYDDVSASLKSIDRLRSLQGIRVLISSWDDPRKADEVQQVLSQGTDQINTLHRQVVESRDELQSTDAAVIGRHVFQNLALPENAFNPLFLRTIQAHLRA